MTESELDVLWQRALHESVAAGEQFTRYRFAALVRAEVMREMADSVHPAAADACASTAPPQDSFPDQTILHAEQAVGNCLQATVAGILGWPLDAVPHFALLGDVHWWDCLMAWLDSQGLWIDYKADSYKDEGGALLPLCWLSGPTVRGTHHAVIGDTATGQMLHDPHPSRAGLTQTDFTVYFFRKPAPHRRSVAGDQKPNEQAESASPSVLLIRGEK